MPWCFPVSEAAAKAVSCRLQGLLLKRAQRYRGLGSAVGTGMPWCFPVSEAAAKAVSCRLQGLLLKATLGSGTGASEAPLGPACHGVFPFRKRPPKPSAAGFKGYFSSGLRKRR